MQQGTYRKAITIGMLAFCLWVAAPLTTDARPLEPSDRDGVAAELQEGSLWQSLWHWIESLWSPQSVLIDPFGLSDGDGDGEPAPEPEAPGGPNP